MERFPKIVKDWKVSLLKKLTQKLTIFKKSSIFNIWQGSEAPLILLQKLVSIRDNFPGDFANFLRSLFYSFCGTREQVENIIAKFDLWFKILN